MNPENDRLIDRMLALLKERGHITANEASEILGVPRQNCGQVLRKLFRNWDVVERRAEHGYGRGKSTIYYLKE